MVVIRLSRVGAKHSPKYRVTVADSRRARGGKFIEIVGSYNPIASGKAPEVTLDMDKVNAWIAKGAQPSDTVKSLIRKVQAAK